MAESSVDSYINAQPEQAMDWESYWRQNNDLQTGSNSNAWMNKIYNFFTGGVDKVKAQYQAYLDNINNKNEWLAQQSARAYDKLMDDSKYQRMMMDFEKAGLNPYLLINNGGISASSSPSSSAVSYKHNSGVQSRDNSQAGRNIALLVLAVARIAAALL